jgi:hypothetical protein
MGRRSTADIGSASSGERPESAHLVRCRTTWRRSPKRAHSRRSASAAGTALYAPLPTFITAPAEAGPARPRTFHRTYAHLKGIHGLRDPRRRRVKVRFRREASTRHTSGMTLVHPVTPFAAHRDHRPRSTEGQPTPTTAASPSKAGTPRSSIRSRGWCARPTLGKRRC